MGEHYSSKDRKVRGMELLLVRELAENFTEHEINKLIESGKNSRDILICDYFIGRGLCDHNIANLPTFNWIINVKYPPVSGNEERYFKFMTPKKRIVMRMYAQHLSRDLLAKFPSIQTKKELKQLYCLDEIVSKLDEIPNQKVDFSKDIPFAIASSIEHYKNQEELLKAREDLEEFSGLLRLTNYSKISLNIVKHLKSRSDSLMKYSNKESQNPAIIPVVESSKKAIKELDKKLKEGIEKSLDDIEDYFDGFSKKDSISSKELSKLKSDQERLSELEKILTFLGYPTHSVSNALKKQSKAVEEGDYFFKSQNLLGLIMRDQRQLNYDIKSTVLGNTYSPFEFLKRGRVRHYVGTTIFNLETLRKLLGNNKYMRHLNTSPQNNSLSQMSLAEEFKSIEYRKNWSEKLMSQKKVLTNSRKRYSKRRIKKIDKLLESIDNFDKELKASFADIEILPAIFIPTPYHRFN